MAKWGEGDPRWIVEERPDTANVNNWHWTEKNANQWSRDQLKELLVGLTVRGDGGTAEITEIDSMEGEASANNRKAKLIFFYEWNLNLKWKATAGTDASVVVHGNIHVPNLSDENDAEDVDVEVTCADSTAQGKRLKEMVARQAPKLVRAQCAEYVRRLKSDFTRGMILPTKDGDAERNGSGAGGPTQQAPAPEAGKSATRPVPVVRHEGQAALMDAAETIELRVTFMASPDDVYAAHVEPGRVQAFTRDRATGTPAVGEAFTYFNGNVEGSFVALEPGMRIVQRWRMRSWPASAVSTVEITLRAGAGQTELKLRQTGVPAGDCERVREGWSDRFWLPMKLAFGWGMML